MALKKVLKGSITARISMCKVVVTAMCLLAWSTAVTMADWQVITDFEDKEAQRLTGWNSEQGAGANAPLIEVVDVEGEGNESQQCLELKFKSPGTWSKVNYEFPVDMQIGEEYASKSIKFLLKGDGTNLTFNLRLMESTPCAAHPNHPGLVYIPKVPLADSGWQEVIFELTPEVFVPHDSHADENDKLDWPMIGLVIGVSGATTTFYVDEIKVGEGEEEKAVSSSNKLAVTWGSIKGN
jgi:hypothetical protein